MCRYNAVRFTYVFFTSILLGLAFWQVGQDRCGASTPVRNLAFTYTHSKRKSDAS